MPYQREDLHVAAGRGQEVATLTVDDHAGFREALRDLVAAARGFVLVGEACSGEEAVDAVDRLAPRLVVMDVVMPGMGGVAATRMILRQHPGLVVVLVSVDDPGLYAGARTLGTAVALMCKQNLRPDSLRRLWEAHGNFDLDPASSIESKTAHVSGIEPSTLVPWSGLE